MHRLTQTVDVIVYKLTVEDTVEERILELQEKKRLLALHAIEGGTKKNKDALKLSLQDLMNLFKPRHDGIVGPENEGDGRQLVDGRAVGQDVDEMMRGIVDLRKKKHVVERKRENELYGRRW